MTGYAAALDLIRNGATTRDLESESLEFKEEDSADPRRSLEMLADAVVCLANAEGGEIVFGVANGRAGTDAFRGVSTKITVDIVRRGIFDRTRPSLSVPVAEVHEGASRLIAITVPKGAVYYANGAGTATRRVGTECRPFPPEEQRQAMAARGLYDWSAELDPQMAGDVDVLLALSRLRDARSIRAPTLASLAQRSGTEAQHVLERMAQARMVEPTRRTASRVLPTYVLTGSSLASLRRAVRYHVRRVDETDRKVTEHLREYGHMTNQTLRRLFDLDVPGARDLLRALQQRGVVVKIDRGRGGPGIRYGPGPRLQTPEARRRAAQVSSTDAEQLPLVSDEDLGRDDPTG
jgi:predicted HTH transcriptional regulator